jgi:signal recognition particle receptor subunit beta
MAGPEVTGAGVAGAGVRAVKVVMTGPVGAGKTTLISTISETVVAPSDEGALDFGRVTIDDGLVLYLFGTYGQARYQLQWEILSTGMLGFVVLVDGSRPESATEAARMLELFRGRAPHVIAVNQLPADGAEAVLAEVCDRLGLPPDTPLLRCDARDRESVKAVLLALVEAVAEAMDRAAAPASSR